MINANARLRGVKWSSGRGLAGEKARGGKLHFWICVKVKKVCAAGMFWCWRVVFWSRRERGATRLTACGAGYVSGKLRGGGRIPACGIAKVAAGNVARKCFADAGDRERLNRGVGSSELVEDLRDEALVGGGEAIVGEVGGV